MFICTYKFMITKHVKHMSMSLYYTYIKLKLHHVHNSFFYGNAIKHRVDSLIQNASTARLIKL